MTLYPNTLTTFQRPCAVPSFSFINNPSPTHLQSFPSTPSFVLRPPPPQTFLIISEQPPAADKAHKPRIQTLEPFIFALSFFFLWYVLFPFSFIFFGLICVGCLFSCCSISVYGILGYLAYVRTDLVILLHVLRPSCHIQVHMFKYFTIYELIFLDL